MKILFLILLFLIAACDPFGFGFKNNPAFILDEAFKSISRLDHESLLEVTGKETLCLYANQDGILYLKEKIDVRPENLNINPKVLSSSHYKIPHYVGYWSYYAERYQIDIESKETSQVIMRVIVDCDYGTDQQKDDRLIGLKAKRYKVKECRLTKIVPMTFKPLEITKRCELLRVNL